MLIKTSDLIGSALDWAVAKCEGLTLYKDALLDSVIKRGVWVSGLSIDPNTWKPLALFNPSTDWSQGGPIIEREKIDIGIDWDDNNKWIAGYSILAECMNFEQRGSTPLISAMRCYVASKLGDTVEIPEELCL